MGTGIGKAIQALRTKALTSFSPRHQLNHGGRGQINFIDVGSVGALPEPWFSNQNAIRFLLNFEPNDPIKRTRDSRTLDTALWECTEERPFYVYKGFSASGSSLFEQNNDYVRQNFEQLKQRGPRELAESWFERSELIKQSSLRCQSLDAVLGQAVPEVDFHFLKIDAQGAEMNILRGAEHLLRGPCMGLHMELFTMPLYKGITLMPEVQAHCEGLGYRLVKKFPAHGSFDSQHDCLFLRDGAAPALTARIRQIYGL
jgi:FkbM family methyltransferase